MNASKENKKEAVKFLTLFDRSGIHMKASKYNFFFPYESDENKIIAYNSYSNALALMEKCKYDVFQQFVNNGVPIVDNEFIAQLKQGCFLIDSDVNELDWIRLRMLQSRFNTDSLGLTIIPTADCNFRCPYCYEKDVIRPEYMTAEVEEATIKLAELYMRTIVNLNVTWYGGEALMNIEAVDRLSKKLIAMCDEHNVNYKAYMVTNGYLLTKEIAQQLTELKIDLLQITLDGCDDAHNQRRPLADGSGTFFVIIENLINCKDVMPPVSLRINIDKYNTTSGADVTRLLDENGLLGKVSPYISKVFHGNDSHNKASCFDACSFSSEEVKYFNEFASDETYMKYYPKPIRNYCGADSLNSYVIAADGKIYKCWHDVGSDIKHIGSLIESIDTKESAYLQYMLFDPTADTRCSECNLLPICMGGCPYNRVDRDGDVCTTHKFVLDDFLTVIAKKLKLRKGLAENASISNDIILEI